MLEYKYKEDVNMFKKEYMDYDGDTLKIRERSADDKMMFLCNEIYVSRVVLSKEQALDLANSIIKHEELENFRYIG